MGSGKGRARRASATIPSLESKSLDPDLVHKTTWEKGSTLLRQLVYRPKCSCGWRGQWLPSIWDAKAVGRAHVEEAAMVVPTHE